jgi:hypothetical protein
MSPLYLEGISVETATAHHADAGYRNVVGSEQRVQERKRDERAFYMLFMLTFPLFLIAVVAHRVLPGSTTSGSATGKSIMAEAGETTSSTLAIALTN